MLERLRIRDFAVARDVELQPGPGLNVFTGETGAGKSLVVDALAFVFGARRGREVIAGGAGRAVVEATVRLDGRPIAIERAIALSGRSSARVDGELATVERLAALGARLVDIHGQSEQLSILRAAVQLAVLDAFAGLVEQRQGVGVLVRELREVRRQAAALATDERERERVLAQLRYEVDEIESAGLLPGEDEALRAEHERLANASRLLDHAAAAAQALDASPIGEVSRAIADLAGRDPLAAGLAELAATFETQASELQRALRRYQDALEEDPGRLAAVEERLGAIAKLQRKYGDGVEAILAYGREAAARLATLASAGASLEALQGREGELLTALATGAEALSRARRAAAGALVDGIAKQLEHLGMGDASLSVGFACEDDPAGPEVALPDYEVVITESPLAGEGERHARAFTETGVDRVELLASFNQGESPRALSAVASGGETSRFLLALTTVLGGAAEPRLVVFDEVDEGVGGRAGALVGEALARLAERHQVLCVTHLPQVAAYGAHHFIVHKESDGGRSWSDVREVAGEERVAELAAMLGGETEATRRAAGELLAQAAGSPASAR